MLGIENESHECKNRGRQTHNPRSGGPTHTATNLHEQICCLLDRLTHQACVELIRRLLTTISYLPTVAARPRAVLKTVIFFMAEYGRMPYEDGTG